MEGIFFRFFSGHVLRFVLSLTYMKLIDMLK